jgi:two-component system sensor histidine kinase HydH
MSDAAVLEESRGADAPRPPGHSGGRMSPGSPAAPPSLQQYTELAELAGGFIHEIKNHLGTLSLNLQLLAEDFENPQTQRERRALERVTRLHGECQRLVDLSADFLRFARVQELHPEPTPLDAVVTRMIDFLAPTARQKNIEINWFPAPDLPPARLDRELFEQALLNLMLNAEQAMPDGGTLTLIGRTEGDRVCLEVIDTGHGMTPDVLAKLFRPFHTTKQTGSGLGLPTTRKIVLAHGGTIDVQSEPGRGSKFTIRLPAAAASVGSDPGERGA